MAQGHRPKTGDAAIAAEDRPATAASTVGEALRELHRRLEGRASRSPREDAEAILAWVLGRDRVFLLAHPEAVLTQAQAREVRRWTRLRAQHFPLQYMRGEQEFWGRPFRIDRSTLIPRPETEVVVETALRELAARRPGGMVLDVGTGSGCIAVSLACERSDLKVVALDVSPGALRVARDNARRLGCENRVRFQQSDVLSALPSRPCFDLVVSNPPYVAWEDRRQVDPSVALYEPASAVFAGRGGLEFYGKLLAQAPAVVKPAGRLVVELGYDLCGAVSSLAGRLGWRRAATANDLAGNVRCAVFELKNRALAKGADRRFWDSQEGETA